ncbi:MAG: PEP-CTERM sorting domain-containing protein [Akkermansiaceae bacterium]|nr:PEP-CTERM sorting domain-containing protein [Akkermansiaceae bacterium]NNM30968.1 PEP-CTERM sorting domain-containing protein [Akkermansiaceae bacterium]
MIALPDLVVGASIPFDIKIYNDTGSTRPVLGLSFTVPSILPAPLALSLSSPDLGLDPPEGPGFFDLAVAGAGSYTATIGGVSGGVPDGAGVPPGTPDGTFLFLYAPSPTGGPSTVTFTGVSLLVPEPGSALLALVGVAGLLVRRRR